MYRLLIASFIAASFAACVGTRTIGPQQGCPCAPGWTCDPTQDICVPNGSSAPDGGVYADGAIIDGDGGLQTKFSPDQVQAALANCSLPHGPPDLAGTPSDEAARLVGAWLLCPPTDTQPMTMFAPGILFESDGTFQRLAMTDDGGVQAGIGLLSQGTWSTWCYNVDPSFVPDYYTRPCSGTSFYGIDVDAHTVGGDDSPANCFVGAINFESSPARAYVIDPPGEWCSVAYASDIWDFWLVPLQ